MTSENHAKLLERCRKSSQKVRDRAEKLQAVQIFRDTNFAEASRAGISLRTIADVSGVSHAAVAKGIQRVAESNEAPIEDVWQRPDD